MQDFEFYEYRDVKNDLTNTNVDARIRKKKKRKKIQLEEVNCQHIQIF